jgi:integrase/recombinase XerD
MTALERHLEDYLAIPRGLGFKLVNEQRALRRFVEFMDDVGEPTVTIELALRWATLPAGVGHAYLSQRMRAVRGFARCLHGIDPSSEVPPLPLLPARKHRPTPHIYTDREVVAMMAAARALLPPLRAATMETLIGLLASTGIRDSEAFALERTDIDRTNRLLRIRDSKYGKSREVLVHDSTIAKLDAYLTRRDQLRAGGDRTCVFVSCWGARLSHKSVHRSFGQIRQASGLTRSASGHRPRLHDLRHTFAVNTLVGWYRNGENVAAKLPLLWTYLGHVDPAATYWYLSAVPELLALAAQRLEQHDNDDTAAPDREVALLLRELERVRHWRARRPGR